MKKILSFTKIGILFTCLCLFSVGAFGAEAKTEPEWKIHQTVNRSFIELPDFYVPAPIIEELEPDTELKFFQEFNTSKNDKDTLAFSFFVPRLSIRTTSIISASNTIFVPAILLKLSQFPSKRISLKTLTSTAAGKHQSEKLSMVSQYSS